jgi:hypothetical protein
MLQGGIQLPDDVISKGYRKTGRFEFQQIFYSPSLNFTGTEQEFINKRYAYKYIQLDSSKRITCE